MASVSGSQLAFKSGGHEQVNLILSDGKTVSGSTVAGALNIEVFTTALGSALPGVDGTAFIQGAVQVSKNAVQAGSLSSTEQLGTGSFIVIDDTSKNSASQHAAPQGETLRLGTGAQTVVGSSGDTIIGGDATSGHQLIDLTGKNHLVTDGPMTAVGGAGSLVVKGGVGDSIAGGTGEIVVFAGSSDTITGGSGPETVFGAGAGHGDRTDSDDDDKSGKGKDKSGKGDDHDNRGHSQASNGQGDEDDDKQRGKQDNNGNHGQGGNGHQHQNGAGGHGQNGNDDQDHNGTGGIGNNTITGGTGQMTVIGGRNDLITGSSGALTIVEDQGGASSGDTIVGGSGALTVQEYGKGDTITGGSGTNFVQTYGSGGNNLITGGTGTVTGAGGHAVNTYIVSGAGDTISGSKGSMSVDGSGGHAMINAGLGGTTVNGGSGDVINNLGKGTLLVDINSRDANSTVQSGAGEQVNLGSGHGATTLRDISIPGGHGPLASTTVTGFSAPTDIIASSTSVNDSNKFLGTSSVSGGNTVLTFVDGAKVTLVGITDISKLMFVK